MYGFRWWGIPPDREVRARFGNPAFRTWHGRLVERSYGIVRCLMDCHATCRPGRGGEGEVVAEDDDEEGARERMLGECHARGYRAASDEGPSLWPPRGADDRNDERESVPGEDPSSRREERVVAELRAYLHDAFGHPVCINYGTGHDASFVVFLLACCKIGCFAWSSRRNDGDGESEGKSDDGNKRRRAPPSPGAIGPAALSLFHAYLDVTRGLQRDYMLEPAGSHGVWGLDDYHCVPFYLGACQMVAREEWQRRNGRPNAKSVAAKEGGGGGSKGDVEEDAEKRLPENPPPRNAL